FAYEFASANRVVHMGEYVESPIESYMGWSNGRWEGDTLVVEVTGFNGLTWFDRAGNHHSNELKVTERYTLNGPNHIAYEATIEDPKTFSRPWTISLPLYRRLDEHAQVLEYKCVEFAEELLYGHLKKVDEEWRGDKHMRTELIAGAAAAVPMAVSADAPHAFSAELDNTKPIRLEGTGTKWERINAH